MSAIVTILFIYLFIINSIASVKSIASGKQPHSTGRSAWCFVTT